MARLTAPTKEYASIARSLLRPIFEDSVAPCPAVVMLFDDIAVGVVEKEDVD